MQGVPLPNTGVIAKISRPRLGAVYARERLFRQLDLYDDRPVTWISGPPGAGKTTLANSYLDTGTRKVLWFRLDRRDEDVATFFHFLLLAARWSRTPSIAAPMQPDPDADIEIASRQFFERFFAAFDMPFAVVFDNYHSISVDSVLHEVFRFALECVPSPGRILVASRAEPPHSLSRLESYGALARIGADHLRLDDNEARGIAGLSRNWGRQRKRVADLHRKTEGWTAGLVLLLAHADPGVPLDDIPSITRSSLFRYFRAEILDRSDPFTREVLLKCSLPPTISTAMAHRLTGNPDAARIIAKMHENNFFTERLTSEDPIYRFHPLFREFLIDSAEAVLSRAELQALRRMVARLLEMDGMPEEALAISVQSGDWKHVLRLCDRLAPEMLAQGRARTLKALIDRVPPDVRDNDMGALLWLGHADLARDPARAAVVFERAFGLAESRGDRTRTLASWCGVVDAIVYNWDDFTQLDPWIEWLERVETEGITYPSAAVEAQVLSSLFAALMFRRPDHPRIHEWAERGLNLARQCGDASLLIRLTEVLSHFYMWIGDLGRTGTLLAESSRLLDSATVPVMVSLGNRMLEAVYRWHCADFSAAIAAVEDGLAEARRQGVHLLDARIAAQGVYASTGSGDLAAAAHYLDLMRDAPTAGHKLDISHYHFLRGWHALLTGEEATALAETRRGNLAARELGAPFPIALSGYNLARVIHLLGDRREAHRHIEFGLGVGERMGSHMLAFQGKLIAADFALAEDDEDLATRLLVEALAIGRHEGFFTTPVWDDRLMSRLCAFALDHEIEPIFVRRLVWRRRLAPPGDRPAGPGWPWPVRMEMLGGFRLTIDDQPLAFNRKARSRPLELVRALAALGGCEVSETLLADLLWPSSEGDAAAQSLATTLHRARKLLGHDDALVRQEGRISINRRVCWCDAIAFTERLDEAESLVDGEWRKSRIARAVELYGGPFLDGHTENSWSIAARERLEERFSRAIEELARTDRSVDATREVYWYGYGIERAPGCETLYRESIRAHLACGQSDAAIAMYRRLRNTLETTSATEPSRATRDLVASLLPGPD